VALGSAVVGPITASATGLFGMHEKAEVVLVDAGGDGPPKQVNEIQIVGGVGGAEREAAVWVDHTVVEQRSTRSG
jgi:hypothetical protein